MESQIQFPEHIEISRSYHRIPMDGDRVLLTNSHDSFVLKGKNLDKLLSDLFVSLETTTCSKTVIEELASTYSRETLVGILSKLLSRRVIHRAILVNERNGLLQKQTLYFNNFADTPEKVLSRLLSAKVAVFGLGPLGGHLALGLARSGVGAISVHASDNVQADEIALSHFYKESNIGKQKSTVFIVNARKECPKTQWENISDDTFNAETLPRFDYLVACSEKYEPAKLEKLNELAVQTKTPFIWACFDGRKGLIGPTVLPDETACFKCYQTRVLSNADHPEMLIAYESYLKTYGNNAEFGYLLPHVLMVSGMAALEIVKDLSYLTPPITYNAQLEINMVTMEYELHPVLKIPRCPVCSRSLTAGPPVRPFMEREG